MFDEATQTVRDALIRITQLRDQGDHARATAEARWLRSFIEQRPPFLDTRLQSVVDDTLIAVENAGFTRKGRGEMTPRNGWRNSARPLFALILLTAFFAGSAWAFEHPRSPLIPGPVRKAMAMVQGRGPGANEGSEVSATAHSYGYARGVTDFEMCKKNLKDLGAGMEIYFADHGRYPEKLNELAPDCLREVPRCPSAGADSYSAGYVRDESGNGYTIACQGQHHTILGYGANSPRFSPALGLTATRRKAQ